MSDFDTVLERLLFDGPFKAALAADPARALAGYALTPDERELLHAQVSTDSGGERTVEQRTSKASMFGLLSSLGGTGVGSAADATSQGGQGASAGFGESGETWQGETWQSETWQSGVGQSGVGQSGVGEAGHSGFAGAVRAGLGEAGQAGVGAAGRSGLGEAGWIDLPVDPHAAVEAGLAEAREQVHEQIGTVYSGGTYGSIGQELNDLTHQGQGGVGAAAVVPPPADYHPHIDVNGDGRWDQYTVRGRADGGVDIVADMDRDGRADFVGHDLNRDGLVESADYDKDHDGVFENHQFDVNGDGWLDRSVTDPKPAPEIPQEVAERLRFGGGAE
jgi:hypothetical protein